MTEHRETMERVRLMHDQNREFEFVESEPYTVAERLIWGVKILVDGKAYRGSAEIHLAAPAGTNPFEDAETSALGRALVFAGLGPVESITPHVEASPAIQVPAMKGQANDQATTSKERQTASPPAKTQRASAGGQPAQSAAPVPLATTQSKPLLDMIGKAKKRVESLGMLWDDVKRDALKKRVEDGDLTVVQVAEVNKLITHYEKRVAEKSSKVS